MGYRSNLPGVLPGGNGAILSKKESEGIVSERGIAAGQMILTAIKQGRDVLAEYDLEVIGDMTEADGSTEDEPKWKPVFYLGKKPDMAAGLVGFALGCQPAAAFATEAEALLWAGAHANEIRKEMGW